MEVSVLLALDVGDVFVGCAIARGNRAIEELEVLKRAGGRAERGILEIIETEQVDLIVAGLPLNEKGQETTQSELARKFVARIIRRSNCKVVWVDEYGSSLEAKQRYEERRVLGMAGKGSGRIDSIAASIILQTYLNDSGNA